MGTSAPDRQPLSAEQRAALDSLVREFTPRLIAYVRRAYPHLSDPEEVVAEVICRAAQNLPRLLDCQRQDLYLLTAARNLCRDGHRRERPVGLPDGAAMPVDPSADPSGTAARAEEHEALRQAVAELPEALREVIVLRFSVGLKFEEIAEMLAIPLGTALSRVHTALRRLRGALEFVHGH